MTEFPIEGVTVFNNTQKKSAFTDKDGYFSIDIFSNTDTLYFKHIVFRMVKYTKNELRRMDYEVYLQPSMVLMQEFNITASNIRENAEDLPYVIDIIDAKEIRNMSSQSSADILMNTGNVLVQKSQGGGGSPIIRGFEANKVLLVLDGVRMNNAIYRSGHLQNSITVDNSILRSTEIIYGPTSTIYGSDALGGVIHYHTKIPKVSKPRKFDFDFNAYTQYSTANKGKIGHLNFNLGFKNFASLTAFTIKDLGDIKIGKNKSFTSGIDDFGHTKHYVTQDENNNDITTENPDPEIQLNTGYKQYDFLQKFKYVYSKKLDIVANFQYSTSSKIDRYDQLTEYNNDDLKYSEWHYGPQKRFFSSIKFFAKNNNTLYTNFSSIISFQNINEDRISRKFNKDRLHQEESLKIYSLNFDFLKLIDNVHRLSYGLEASYNDVSSNAYYEDIANGTTSIAQTRYPNGGGYMMTYAAYANFKWVIIPQFVVNSGIRYSYVKLKSSFLDDGVSVELPFSSIEIGNGATTGTLSLVYFPSENWQISLIGATGFRSPNIDDYGKVRAKSGLVTVPNDQLKPEYAYNIEFGFMRTLFTNIFVEISIYKTWLKNAIVRRDYQLNNSNTLIYDGDEYNIITNLNAAEAELEGFSSSIYGSFDIFPTNKKLKGELKIKTTLNYIRGKNIVEDVYLGHIPPAFGILTINYENNKLGFNISGHYHDLKKLSEMSPFGEDNDDKGTPVGFPSWWNLNFGLFYNINKSFVAQIAIDNIFDERYRVFASGVTAPGRSFIFTLRYNFNY